MRKTKGRPAFELDRIQNQDILSNVESLNKNLENINSRLENHSELFEKLSQLTENYEKLSASVSQNTEKVVYIETI